MPIPLGWATCEQTKLACVQSTVQQGKGGSCNKSLAVQHSVLQQGLRGVNEEPSGKPKD